MRYEMTKILKDKGWTLAEVASTLSVTQRQMSNIVRNPKEWHIKHIINLPVKRVVVSVDTEAFKLESE